MFDKITKKNWLFYAIKNYNVPNLDSEQEFYEDVKRFKYLKRLFRKYKTTGESTGSRDGIIISLIAATVNKSTNLA